MTPERRALAPNPKSLIDAFRAGQKTFAEAGGLDAYFGDPRAATAAEGEATFRIMAEILVVAVREALGYSAAT